MFIVCVTLLHIATLQIYTRVRIFPLFLDVRKITIFALEYKTYNMSKFVIYLKLQPFVAQWLHHHYGDPVRFQPMSVENATILQFTQKLPAGKEPDTSVQGLTAVCIPDNEKKDPATFNYLGKKGKEAVVDCIERTFKLMMWSELNDMSAIGCSVLNAIDAWCEMHGIDIEYDRTILMRYNRLRKSYEKKGIDLRRRKRNR